MSGRRKGELRDVQSQHRKRVASGSIAIAAVLAIFGTKAPALADPDPLPPDASEQLQDYQELVAAAEQLNEEHLRAQDDLAAAEAALDEADADLDRASETEREARADETELREVVDQFAGASFTGQGEMNQMSAVLNGGSPQDFLERSEALDVLAADRNEAIDRLAATVARAEEAEADAEQAQNRAEDSRDEAATLTADIEERQEVLDERIDEVEEAAESLTAEDEEQHRTEGAEAPEDTSGSGEDAPEDISASGDVAQDAIDAAMSVQGSPYEWGAQGPSAFDCSGLTSWAFSQAGVDIPRSSSAQAGHGQAVSRDELQPGDLVTFYQPVSHVGIYVGDGKMLHAPQQGDVVKVDPMMESDFSGGRRVG